MTNDTLLSLLVVKINGQTLPTGLALGLEEIVVETSLHLPSVATLAIHDPQLEWLDSPLLEPGKDLTVASEEGGVLFDGEIVEVEADLSLEGQRVVVRAFDRLHRLARGTHSRAFTQVSDADIVKKCAGDVGLSAEVAQTPGQHPYYIQANESNLALLQRRAAANGFLLYANGRKVCFKPPEGEATIALEWGLALGTFRPRLSSLGRVEKVTVRGWDPQKKQAVVGVAQSSKAAPSIGLAPKNYFPFQANEDRADLALQTQDAARRVAQARVDAHTSRFVEAEGVALGDPRLKAGVAVRVTGVGKRFSGTYFVTAATHRIRPGTSYSTEFSVSGLNPASILGLLGPAEGERHPLGGLTIGIVTDNKDPEKLGRVKVKFPLLIDDATGQQVVTSWARLGASGAGAQRGMLFLPEVNDEVLVAFGNGDTNLPIVLGALWNGMDKPPGQPGKLVDGAGKVAQRVIYSRTGHYIMLDDSDADGGISIVDKNGNKLILKAQDNSLTIQTQGNISVRAQGNLALEAQGNLSLQANGNLSLRANGNLTAEARGQAQVSGSGGANLESAAVVTVKGSMINLN